DAREEGEFAEGHPLWAANCPLSRREWRARALLGHRPPLDLPILCCDGGEGHAEALARFLEGLGFRGVFLLDGGAPAWARAGFELFSGINVPSKAFGEWVEHRYGTPSLPPEEAEALIRAPGTLLLDSRPAEEFRVMTIPGARNLPGGELALRAPALIVRPDQPIVVNCAGRTRSILGAESLRRLGLPNPVLALRNGTMGWELSGRAAERGRTDVFDPDALPPSAAARAAAARFAAERGVRVIGRAEAEALLADDAAPSFLLDVRDPKEYAAGHWPGAASAPGGQLVQATDRWVGVRHARLILLDGGAHGQADGVRARMAGGWLRELGGFPVFVVETDTPPALLAGPERPEVPEAPQVPAVLPAALAEALAAGGTAVVDVGRSTAFRAGHIPGALWGIRGRLAALAPRLGAARQVVATAEEPLLARFAAAELSALTGLPAALLAGGTAAWAAAGLPIAADPGDPPDSACVDVFLRPYDRNQGVAEAMRAYLDWETGLMAQVARDGDAPFGAW
ncbi:MAG: rhodanese-like domain-containing protein, partial [Acetobacteraceae bacterium]|nr:rhodanese-like domain-containing protein [Acetobacteraceae bacterium]